MCDPLLKSTLSLSVIVPAYNKQHLVARDLACLRSLGESPRVDRARVIVVGDGSTDGTAVVLGEVAS